MELLPDGLTEDHLRAHGIAIEMMVNDGSRPATDEGVRTGSRVIAVACVWITDKGRRALA
jgi:hypothetical protein